MTTHKLKLKRTPEEEAQHRLRKERRKEKKRKREQLNHDTYGTSPKYSSKRLHVEAESTYHDRKWASSDEEETEFGPQPAPSSSKIPPYASYAHKPDYDALKAEMEEQIFREKMFEALGDDERLDSVEARFNDFAQVPHRWRTAASSGLGTGKSRANIFEGDDFLKLDPRLMDEEEYAEWIRAGMYRKTHADEYAEQQRQKATQASRRAEEKARKAEAARLEKIAEEERKMKKLERESRRLDYAREEYNMRWAVLLSTTGDRRNAQVKATAELTFDDIPWPIATAHQGKPSKRSRRPGSTDQDHHMQPKIVSLEELTADAISSFLLPVVAAAAVGPEKDEAGRKKERKDRLREAFLRFHPDKFEGRFMQRVKQDEHEKVREAIGQVSRVLNSLMGDGD